MSNTRVIFMGVALGSAALAAFLAKGVLSPQAPSERVVEINKVEMSEVLVVKQEVRQGEKVTRAAIGWQSWPQASVRKGMITKTTDEKAREKFVGAHARIPLFEGDPVNGKKLVLPGSSGFMAAILPKGRRAVSVRISEATGAGGFILPNDRVDVLVTKKQNFEGAKGTTVTELVLSNVKVLAINQSLGQNAEGEQYVIGKTATLELEPRQAEVLAKVETSGQLILTLRSIADSGSKKMGDDGPRLSPQYAKGGGTGNAIKIYRYGIKSLSAATK
ncbi:Flp pilus assembly protein RcpC/CpaB [hydrothermal vent metagenome]|uniref:Flp pilus assembly protein RcpC/CpaB n=1 Tax=hydrothermal vent metagenome TaxID=652676 RepID=A0A3B0T3F8_9ZZZZ